jgi:hypothetical protein
MAREFSIGVDVNSAEVCFWVLGGDLWQTLTKGGMEGIGTPINPQQRGQTVGESERS